MKFFLKASFLTKQTIALDSSCEPGRNVPVRLRTTYRETASGIWVYCRCARYGGNRPVPFSMPDRTARGTSWYEGARMPASRALTAAGWRPRFAAGYTGVPAGDIRFRCVPRRTPQHCRNRNQHTVRPESGTYRRMPASAPLQGGWRAPCPVWHIRVRSPRRSGWWGSERVCSRCLHGMCLGKCRLFPDCGKTDVLRKTG